MYIKCSGDRRAKLHKHNFTKNIPWAYNTDQNINLDINSGNIKTSHQTTFEEAWYLQDSCPPAAQLLYTLGLEDKTTSTTCPPPRPVKVAVYPSLPSNTMHYPSTVSACMTHLPLCLSPEPAQNPPSVHTTKRSRFIDQLSNTPRDDTNTSWFYGVSSTYVAQAYMSPSLYNNAFKEELNLWRFDFTKHRAAGMPLVQQGNRLILASMVTLTPRANIPR